MFLLWHKERKSERESKFDFETHTITCNNSSGSNNGIQADRKQLNGNNLFDQRYNMIDITLGLLLKLKT